MGVEAEGAGGAVCSGDLGRRTRGRRTGTAAAPAPRGLRVPPCPAGPRRPPRPCRATPGRAGPGGRPARCPGCSSTGRTRPGRTRVAAGRDRRDRPLRRSESASAVTAGMVTGGGGRARAGRAKRRVAGGTRMAQAASGRARATKGLISGGGGLCEFRWALAAVLRYDVPWAKCGARSSGWWRPCAGPAGGSTTALRCCVSLFRGTGGGGGSGGVEVHPLRGVAGFMPPTCFELIKSTRCHDGIRRSRKPRTPTLRLIV